MRTVGSRALRYCQKLYFGILLKQYLGITKYYNKSTYGYNKNNKINVT